jgi:hypothetical protein
LLREISQRPALPGVSFHAPTRPLVWPLPLSFREIRGAYEAAAMVSDTEIIATVLRHMFLVNKGEKSLQSAGEDCFRELHELSRQQLVDALDELGADELPLNAGTA